MIEFFLTAYLNFVSVTDVFQYISRIIWIQIKKGAVPSKSEEPS